MAEPESLTAALPPAARFVLGLGILFGFAALGSALAGVLHLPLPGSVLGMLLLWLSLSLGWVRLHWLIDAADGLLGILGLLFVPATVGFLDYLAVGPLWGLWLLVLVCGLLVGAGTAGLVASRLLRQGKEKPL